MRHNDLVRLVQGWPNDVEKYDIRIDELEQHQDDLLDALRLWRQVDAVMCNEGLPVAEELLSQARETTDAAIAKVREEAR